MENRMLVLLCGAPGSGKSTLSYALTNFYRFRNFAIVNPDSIRKDICGDASDQSRNSEVFEKAYDYTGQLLASGKSVIFDATDSLPWQRKNLLEAMEGHYEIAVAVVMTTTLEVCQDRNRLRERQVSPAVVERIFRQLDNHQPTVSEGFDIVATDVSVARVINEVLL